MRISNAALYMGLYDEGHTVTEIAKLCGKAKSTTSTTLKRARMPRKAPESERCPYSPSCFACPLEDCVVLEARAGRVNVI